MTKKSIYYLSPEGVFYSTLSYKGVQCWCQLMLDTATFQRTAIAGIPTDAIVKVVAKLPWKQPVCCTNCEHETTAYDCQTSPDGLVCPKCGVAGDMAPLLPANQPLDIEVFDRGDHEWYWTAGQSYPWGPFPTREDAVFDAESNGFAGLR